MPPASTVPVMPILFPGIGTFLGCLAAGTAVALVAGLLLHRRDPEGPPAIDVRPPDGAARDAAAPRSRLSA